MTNAADDQWGYIPEELRIRYDEEFASIPDAVRAAARRFPDAEALVDGDERWSFAGLEAAMHASVRSVLAMGVRPGDRVALWAPNSARWIIAALGILGAGGILVPVNTRFKGQEAAYVLEKSGATALFVVTDFLDTDYVGMLRAAAPGAPVLRPGRTVVVSGPAEPPLVSWAEFLAAGDAVPAADADAAIDAVRGDTVSDLMFTSGTTGHPKGVRLTHAQSLRAHGWYAKLMDFRAGRPLPHHPAVLPHVRLQGRLDGVRRARRDDPPAGRLRRRRRHAAGSRPSVSRSCWARRPSSRRFSTPREVTTTRLSGWSWLRRRSRRRNCCAACAMSSSPMSSPTATG